MSLKILEIIKNFCSWHKQEPEEKTKQDDSDDFQRIFDAELKKKLEVRDGFTKEL